MRTAQHGPYEGMMILLGQFMDRAVSNLPSLSNGHSNGHANGHSNGNGNGNGHHAHALPAPQKVRLRKAASTETSKPVKAKKQAATTALAKAPKATKAAAAKPAQATTKGFGSKSAFVRSQPTTMPASEVVALAGKQGMKITASLVYNIRSTMKKQGGAKAKAAPKTKAAPAKAAPAAKAAPKAKTAAKATPKTAPKAKAAPATKAKAQTKAAPKAAPAKAKTAGGVISEGRRAVAEGNRPKLTDAMGIVMGSETLDAAQIVDRLTARGWTPGSNHPQTYISFTLSDNKELFERVNRGHYKVKDPKSYTKIAAQFGGPSGKAEGVAAESKATAPKAPAASTAPKAKAKKPAQTVAAPVAAPVQTEEAPAAAAPATEPEPAVETAAEEPAAEETAEAAAETTPEEQQPEVEEDPEVAKNLAAIGIGEGAVPDNPFDAG